MDRNEFCKQKEYIGYNKHDLKPYKVSFLARLLH